MSKLSIALAVGMALLSTGCGTVATGGLSTDRNLLLREQIAELGPSNAYDIVQALRPVWLQKRGSTSFYQEGEIRVYLDGTSIGGIEVLRGIHSDNIESIRFLDERQASYRYGSGHEHGVILVTTKS